VVAATIPNCRAYDPAFAGELAVILDHGARSMMQQSEDVFYYVTVANENYAQPSLPAELAAQVIQGLYCHTRMTASRPVAALRLLGSGAILREVIAAAGQLASDWNVSCEVWSATSFSELAREAAQVARWNRLHPLQQPRSSHLEQCLAGATPIVAASDYVRAYPQLIAPYLTASYTTLGTDGFGRSDTRAALRRFFEIDRHHIAIAALDALARAGTIERAVVAQAIERFGIDTELAAPWTR
jgi:pyruvate dehydrogenase E1 component